LKRSNVVDMT